MTSMISLRTWESPPTSAHFTSGTRSDATAAPGSAGSADTAASRSSTVTVDGA